VILAILALLAWFALGCIILAGVDDDETRLYKWVSEAPAGLYAATVMLWPAVVLVWRLRT
jgi:hypothetical protein